MVVMVGAGQRNKLTGKREGGKAGSHTSLFITYMTIHYITLQGLEREGTNKDYQRWARHTDILIFPSSFPFQRACATKSKKESLPLKVIIVAEIIAFTHTHIHTYSPYSMVPSLSRRSLPQPINTHTKKRKKDKETKFQDLPGTREKRQPSSYCLNGLLSRSHSHSSTLSTPSILQTQRA